MAERRRDSLVPMEATALAKAEEMKQWKLDVSQLETGAEEDEDEIGSDKARKAFLKMIKKTPKEEIHNAQEYQEFANEHYAEVKTHRKADKKNQYKHGTLLHSLANQRDETDQWKLWAKLILDVAEIEKIAILTARTRNDGYGSTCLHVAIRADEVDFVKFICHMVEDPRSAIAATNSYMQTCVHVAIEQIQTVGRSSFQLVDYLVEKADSGVLKMQRNKITDGDIGTKNTCLHDLVHIKLCKSLDRQCRVDGCVKCRNEKKEPRNESYLYAADYLRILDTMAKKCPEALITKNDAAQSPFLFHTYTRSQNEKTSAWGRLELSPVDENDLFTSAPPVDIGPKDRTKDEIIDPIIGEDKLSSKSKPKQTHTKPSSEFSQALATHVSRKLMEHCLSLNGYLNVCESLFGKGYPSSELMFKAAPLTERTTDIHQALSLSPILACVELGLNNTASSGHNSTHSSQSDAKRTAERARETRERLVTSFFQWLRERGVKKIIKLVVSDHPQRPCRDASIAQALLGFDIRHLDWDKEDLCMESLARQCITPNLQEVWLSWSGRNSTLLGWSNREHGLSTLQKLETVYISTGTEWENDSTNRTNLSRFKTRLNPEGVTRKIAVETADDDSADLTFDTNFMGHETQGALKQGNNWLEAVHAFRTALTRKVSAKQREEIKGKIVVAIIDDGVDLEDLQAPQYVAGGWHPDKKAPDRRTMNAWYYSEKKHGTEMAKLIQLICPFVSLYVAKLDTRRLVYKSVAESAAKAIREAVAQGASVISMSWTIYQLTDNKKGIGELKDAIQYAGKEMKGANGEICNTLMFCASEDSGFTAYRQPYPATDCDTNVIKRVGAAGIYGERSEYVNPNKIDYLFPGEIVSTRDVCSGSSASTALAAGLSALILWCAALQSAKAGSLSNGVEMKTQPGAPLKRVTSMHSKAALDTNTADTTTSQQRINFQTHRRMYGLFDKLKSSQENPFVNIIGILREAAEDNDPPAKLIELCKLEVPGLFKDPQ
ncbi:hypothetical protein TWF696_004646 [Orbilia brochopaga]|uniref:Peptidase S8/S53 domain-containing protein n=1 Tax=Orbilia brochopaga TaxID=3140254 RepID=A0AAV9V9A2_9PEZI